MSRVGAPTNLKGKDLHKWLQDPNNPPMYTLDLFHYWQQRFIPIHYFADQQPVSVNKRDVYGIETEVIVRGTLKDVVLCDTQQLAFPERSLEPEYTSEWKGAIIGLKERNLKPWKEYLPEKCCMFNGRDAMLVKMYENWQESDFYQKLKAHLEKYGNEMEEVRTVLCFGLGPLKLEQASAEEMEDHVARAFLQHTAAFLIRSTLEEVQGMGDIRVGVQDPLYCGKCKELLYTKYKCDMMESPTGFEYIYNQNAFIVTKSPTAPVRQIVGDLTVGFGGPAGILCDRIDEDYDVQYPFHDPPSGRLYKFKKENEELELLLDDTGATVEFEGFTLPGQVFEKVGLYLKKKRA
ncbi:hypothetical protein CC80DRAFT_551248 [Byssothecium circinans]|uniref:SRR1-like domain-containing protein n=1 Tax=Byssothecium circinans TaxID=147558 RepID=A0A6A5TN13_9PLEO|nr:hypothetical protein CC80DRAFT_551248 [Byssothecium circinans]